MGSGVARRGGLACQACSVVLAAWGATGCGHVAHDGNPALAPAQAGDGASSGGSFVAEGGARFVAEGGASTGGSTGGGGPDTCDALAPTRRLPLTDSEVTNVVHDLFGVVISVDHGRASEIDLLSSEHRSLGDLSPYRTAADQVTAQLQPCGGAPDAVCMAAFIRKELPLAWRRPVSEDEVAGLMKLFVEAQAIGPQRAAEAVMEGMLTSDSFLYRSELGEPASAMASSPVTLTAHELASALSFTMYDSLPDAELRARADDGSLLEPDVLTQQVDRLLTVPKTQDHLRLFASFALRLRPQKDLRFDHDLPNGALLQDGLFQSGQRFLDDVLWRGHFQDLFRSHRVYANEVLATTFGLPAVLGEQLVALDVPSDERGAGLLTQPAFLANTNAHTASDDVVHRGLSVYDAFVCGPSVGSPPPNESEVAQQIVAADTGEFFRTIDALPECQSCHRLFDPFGYASLSYDVIGRFQKTSVESGQPIDSSATIAGLGDDIDGPIQNLHDLAERLVRSRRASDCVAGNLVALVLSQEPVEKTRCEAQEVEDAFAASGSFVDLFRTLLSSPAFARRYVLAPGK